MGKLRVLLADDHATVREGLRLIIDAQSDMEVIAEAADGRAAILQSQRLRPEVVVMDISMPGMDGLKATAKIKELCPEIKVIALTRHNDENYLQEMLRAGASGYVLKQSASTEVVRAIRGVAGGNSYLDPAITNRVMSGYAGRFPRGDQQRPTISDREAEVLKAIALGYSNKEIAARLNLSVKTIEAHKANCMKKLALRSRIDIVRYAVLKGWLESN
jgi:DNA-binding NarL/FixJ family response regulator